MTHLENNRSGYFSCEPKVDITGVSFLPQVWCDAAVASGEVSGILTITLGEISTTKHPVTAQVSNYEALLEFNLVVPEVSNSSPLRYILQSINVRVLFCASQ